MPSKLDNTILYVLYEQRVFSSMGAIKITDIPLGTSSATMHRRLKLLCEAGLVSKGLTERNANTYYITPKGTNFYKESLGDEFDEGI